MSDDIRERAREEDRALGSAIEDLANQAEWIVIDRCPPHMGETTVTARLGSKVVLGHGTFVRDAVNEVLKRLEEERGTL